MEVIHDEGDATCEHLLVTCERKFRVSQDFITFIKLPLDIYFNALHISTMSQGAAPCACDDDHMIYVLENEKGGVRSSSFVD